MGEKKRILLVDDDPAVTELLELRLDNWFEVIVTNQNYGRMLTTIRDRVRAAKRAGRSLAEVQAAKPTADFDEAWGKGFMTAGDFLAIVYNTTR